MPYMTSSALALLALHGLRLKGFAETDDVAELVGVDGRAVGAELSSLASDGLVAHRSGQVPGWTLTPTGRIENERLLADELDAAGARPAVETAYTRFRQANPKLLDVCTRWQVKGSDGERKLNDHVDPGYDRDVIDDLVGLDIEVRPICADLAAALDRFGIHRPRLAIALARVLTGDYDWFTRPVIPSYHTVWFELHEDLLATLGLDRASETAASAATYDRH
jgi:hypothetical protein